MNVKKKFRTKLRIFDSFSGKSDLCRSESFAESSTPVLLGIKQKSEEDKDELVKYEKLPVKSLRRQRSASTLLEKITSEYRKLPARSVSICYNPTNRTLSPRFKLSKFRFQAEQSKEDSRNDNTADVSAEFEIERFEREFVAPLSARLCDTNLSEDQFSIPPLNLNLPQTPDSVRVYSSAVSVDSDSNYDSGAFSRNSTPEPAPHLPPGQPLQSPPLVISVKRGNQSSTLTNPERGFENANGNLPLPHMTAGKKFDGLEQVDEGDEPDSAELGAGVTNIRLGGMHKINKSKEPVEKSEPAVTVSVGSATKLFVRDLHSQSLPIMKTFRSESGLRLDHDGRPRVTMPHMGTSRLLSPQKPPRLNPPSRSLERNRISTVKLNNLNSPVSPVLSSTPKHRMTRQSPANNPKFETSFTAVSGKGDAFYVRTSNPFRDDILRLNPLTKEQLSRGSSCSSDASSGVSSGCTDSLCCGSQVTVNGQHHCFTCPDKCDDTLSACQHCDGTM